MRYMTTSLALALALACAAGQAADKSKSLQGLQEIKREAKQGAGAKLSGGLLALKRAQSATPAGVAALRAGPQRTLTPAGLRTRDGYVSVSAYGADPAALRDQLVSKGMRNAKAYKRSVSGEVPVAALEDMANTPGLQFIQSNRAITHAGLVTSQGDRSMRSNIARARQRVDGSGVRVGVLSDSYDCALGPFAEGQRFTRAAEDIANGDLPADIHVLKDLADEPTGGCADEGRAMMQIIHDVAPGAPQSFYTAFVSQEDFANGILALAADGAKVIVDDVIYFAEPMFENGIIADAVNTVKKQGVAYFSSAGNNGRAAHQSQFRLSADAGLLGPRHDFQPNNEVDTLQRIVVPGFGDTLIVTNWDEPSISANGVTGSRSDIDVLFYELDGTPVTDCFFADITTPYCQFAELTFNEGGDAVEFVEIINLTDQPAEVQLSIEVFSGPAPTLLKYVWFDFGDPMIVAEFDTQSGTTYGHANAEGAEAVGAAWWFDTAGWGAANHPQCKEACVNSYSSAGGTPIVFDDQGQRKRVPFVGFKPGVTGPDGVNTTFFFLNQTTPAPGGEPDDFPNFFGTSAAAPHVAAVAALMLDQRARDIAKRKRFLGPKQLTPDIIYAALRLSAEDIRMRSLDTADRTATVRLPNSRGFDFDSGFGMVNALNALRLTAGF